MKALSLFIATLAAAALFSTNVPAAEILDLGDFSPKALSLDGSVITGIIYTPDAGRNTFWTAARWTRDTGVVPLNELSSVGFLGTVSSASGDGKVVFGSGMSEDGQSGAIRWTEETGAVSLSDSLGVGPAGQILGIPISVSADGSVVTGNLNNGAYRWTAETGAVLLPPEIDSVADMSADGSVIVGDSHDPDTGGSMSFHWTQESGPVKLQGGPFSFGVTSVETVSADGLVVGGTSGGERGFYWTRESGLMRLNAHSVTDLSGDGSIMLVETTIMMAPAAGLWDAVNGVRTIGEVFTQEHSLDVSGWGGAGNGSLAISADGAVIAGNSWGGKSGGWVFITSEPSSGTLAVIASLAAVWGLAKRRRKRL